MERIVLAGLLLASLIVQTTRSDSRPAAAGTAADVPAAGWAVHVPPPPPPPPAPPPPPPFGFFHGPGDIDIDIDIDDLPLDRLSLGRVIARDLDAGEQATCEPGTVCSFSCEGGGCKVDCESGSVCAVSCEGGRCHNACGDGAVCSLECEGDDCTSTCGEGSICHVGDGRGHDRTEHRRHGRHGAPRPS